MTEIPKITSAERALSDSGKYVMKARNFLNKINLDDIPEGWRTLDDDVPPDDHKIKVTLYLDKTVVRLLKGDGVNWQERVRAILRSYVKLRVSKILINDIRFLDDVYGKG